MSHTPMNNYWSRPSIRLAPLLALAMLASPLELWIAMGKIGGAALAHEIEFKDLVLHHPWSRASASGAKVGVVYLTIRNRSDQADRLIGAASPVAEIIEFHQSATTDAIMAMERRDWVDIPGASETVLAPGGAHLMLLGLGHPLIKGESFSLTLTFLRAGTVTVDVLVQGIADLEPAN